jgi:hypothetical protein
MVKDVCSPNSSGQKPKPQPLPHASLASRKIKHAPVYGPLVDDDQLTQLPEQQSPASLPRASR